MAPPAEACRWGISPLIPRRPARPRAGPRAAELYVKTETSNPTHSFKDRWSPVPAEQGAGSSATARWGCASTGNLANSVAANAACGGPAIILVPATSSGRRSWRTPFTGRGVGGGRDRTTSKPAVLGAGVQAAVGVREHQHAAVLRGGVEDVRVRGRRAAGLAGARPLVARSHRARSTARSCRAFERRRAAGLSTPAAAGDARRPGGGLRAGGVGVRGRRRRGAPVRPTGIAKSLAIGDPADGVLRARGRPQTGGGIEAVDDAEIVEGIRLLARPPASSPRRPAG